MILDEQENGAKSKDELIVQLQLRLEEAEETLNAIRNGEIDAIVTPDVSGGSKVYTLESADYLYRVLVQEMSEGVATLTNNGTIFYSNTQLASLLQVPLAEITGHILNDFIIPEDLETYQTIFDRGLRTKSKGEISIKSVDGTIIPVIISINSMKDFEGVYAVITDLSEQKLHEELKKAVKQIKDSESSLAEAQRIGHIGSWKWNVQTGELIWSDELYRIYGVDPKTFTPTMSSFTKYIHPDDQETLNNIINQIISEGISLEFDFRIISENDSTRVLKTIAEVTEFDEQGNPLTVTGTNQDVTERKKAEEELQTTNEELIVAQNNLTELVNKLKTSNKELEQFAYVASHDLQEPLRMISSFTQLFERRYKDKLDSDADDYIGFIVEGANRMKDLIDDLLAFSRLNTEAREFELTDLENALNDVLFNLEIVIGENNVQITYDSLPIIKCDPTQIRQLFQNLISNAIKFHSDEPPEIHIYLQDSGKEWLFGVSDNGIGIDAKHQKKIFDVFCRLHTRDEFEGTGIGLAICKRIVERHGGKIWVESEPVKGSTFYFTIPKS